MYISTHTDKNITLRRETIWSITGFSRRVLAVRLAGEPRSLSLNFNDGSFDTDPTVNPFSIGRIDDHFFY